MPSTQNDDNRPNNQRPLQGRATSEESHTPSGTAAPGPRSATGCPFNATTAAMAQQGERLTTAQGGRLTTADHSLKAGERGPVLLQDHELREKITHFDHERIPERVVHARGAAAHGVFRANGVGRRICRAGVFDEGQETEVFVRFSTVLGSRGSADTVRDTRGFAVKFYTPEGTWDLVGNNIPVFFIQDGIKFPDVIHAGKPHPDREIPQAQSAHDTFWDFVSLHTEATHHTIWNMSDRGIPRSYRMMEGFGIHTFRVTDDEGVTRLVKFHWKPRLGVHSLLWEEAQLAGGVDPDFHRRDLADAIESGALPEWDLGVQVFPDTADQMFEGIDLLDPTKIVPEELAPVQILGTMTLTANPTNYFAETEQVAFHPGHLPPGIDVTADPLLQGRLFSYLDTQISRLGGPNFSQIPVNRPHADVNDMYRDGMHQSAVHQGVAPYKPNSLDGGMPEDATAEEGALVDSPVSTDGRAVRAAPQSFSDHFSQPRMFYRSLSSVEQDHTVDAYIFELSKCELTRVRQRVVDVLAGVDGDLAARVAEGLGLVPGSPATTTESNPVSPALSQLGGSWPVDGRKVGVLVSENSDPADIAVTVEAVKGVGMVPLVTAVTGTATAGDEESSVVPDRLYRSVRSVEYDAVIIDSLPTSSNSTEIGVILAEVVRHLKPVAVSTRASDDARRAGVDTGAEGVLSVEESSQAVPGIVEALATHRVWQRS
ncbi:catalase [Corynebacterium variabile]|uniref:catalase n=1 Tax=Corynebacterium variabile TaxID=1727 RepID=UPI0035E3DC7B